MKDVSENEQIIDAYQDGGTTLELKQSWPNVRCVDPDLGAEILLVNLLQKRISDLYELWHLGSDVN